MEKLGILGGMGPLAGAYFYTRIIENTTVEGDGGHVPVLLLGDPRIPDRTESILAGDDRARCAILHGIDVLVTGGADTIAIPCNTAHAYLSDMRGISNVPILDMPRLAVAYAAAYGNRRIGLLSTRGCRKAGVYERVAAELGCSTVALPDAEALAVEGLIYRQKGGAAVDAEEYLPYFNRLLALGADCVVLACTEISCAFGGVLTEKRVDALEVLAKTVVALFLGRITEVEAGAFLRAPSR